MIFDDVACTECGVISNGEVVDQNLFLRVHCPDCGAFIRNTTMQECDDFRLTSGKFSGQLLSHIIRQDRWYVEEVLIKMYLKDWQRFVIEKRL